MFILREHIFYSTVFDYIPQQNYNKEVVENQVYIKYLNFKMDNIIGRDGFASIFA